MSSAVVCVHYELLHAQIGRKLFSCSVDNEAFPSSWVISLRDLKLYGLSPPLRLSCALAHARSLSLFSSLSFMFVACFENSVQVKHITMMVQKWKSFAKKHILCGRIRGNNVHFAQMNPTSTFIVMAMHCINLYLLSSHIHTHTIKQTHANANEIRADYECASHFNKT